MKILIIEDDRELAEMLRDSLVENSHTVDLSHDGKDGVFLAKNYEYDVIILDYSLPIKDGLMVCKEIREAKKSAPIIFLSSTGDVNIKVQALENGADDYMTKPFSLSELHARLKALTRRPEKIKSSILKLDDLIVDTNKNQVTRGGKQVILTRKEFNLLEYLMKNAGNVISRTLILEHVWTADCNPFSNTVEVHIRNLRQKLNKKGQSDLLVNVQGRGYMMDTAENLKKFAKK